MSLDLVIRGGTVVDGSGAPAVRADVGVAAGRIATVGHVPDAEGAQVIDAEGLVVTPGFVDAHTHMDAQVLWDPIGSCSCWQGVTTVIMGNCGFTLAPVRRGAEDLVVGNLERAEDISAAAMAAGFEWEWETFPEYMRVVESRPKAINYGAQLGHSALRTWAMGARALDEPATESDLAEMEAQVKEAAAAGAFGFTTSRSQNHETSSGRPVASRLAAWDEVDRLVAAFKWAGGRVFQLAQEPAAHSADPDERAEYQTRLLILSREHEVTVAYGVLGASQLPLLDRAAAEGASFVGLSHSRGVSVALSFRTRLPFDRLPLWSETRSEPLERQREILADPPTRARLVGEAVHGDYGRAIGAEARRPDYDSVRVLMNPLPPNPTVAEVASQRGVHPVEAMIDLALETDFDQFFIQPVSTADEDQLLAVMTHPRTAMTFSDSGAHVSQVVDCSIQTHLLGYWVRQRQAVSLEEAVRMITWAPASAWGVPGRGMLKPGFAADINIIDPDRVAPTMPRLVHDLPAGERRLVQKAAGIEATIVNGEVAFVKGEHTGATSGKLVRRTDQPG
jgi:N-acyl-D-amino-acid deacylase